MSWFRRRRNDPPAAARGSLEIARPWLRPDSTNPSQAGGYVVIANKGTEGDRLLGASSPAAESIEIHAIKVAGPDIRMQARPDGLAIPAGSTIDLKPRGYHLLLKGLKVPPGMGSSVRATLMFERIGAVEVDMAVEAPGPVGDAVLDDDRHRG